MSAFLGRNLLLKVHDGTGFVTIAGLRTESIRLNARSVDITDSGSNGWAELLPEAGIRTVSVTGSGIFRDSGSDALVRSAFFGQTTLAAQLIIPDFGTIEASFLVTSLTYGGTFNGEATFDIGLSSTGEPVFTPA